MSDGQPWVVLLSRYAETIFWLARYIERAENLARILDVQESFSRDAPGLQSWGSVVQLYADEELFFERYNDASPSSVIGFYVMDASNPSSIISTICMARENARVLRPLISTEMWTHLNVFYNQLRATESARMAPSELSRLCALIKENCQTHSGITEGTFYRDQGWLFYQLGRAIERADQTTRVVDIKYHQLLPRREDVGTIVDVNQWHVVLRSLAGYHAYRRHHPSGMRVESVVKFLLFNRAFPRSLTLCAEDIRADLESLRDEYGLGGGITAIGCAAEFLRKMNQQNVSEMIASGLHEFLDGIQMDLIKIANEISTGYFGHTDSRTVNAAQ